MTALGFGGEVAAFYHRFRRGYPSAIFDELAEIFALTRDDVVLDLGCGTGQLARPMAARVRAVLGMDPEPDMLAQARRACAEPNVSWLLGADGDVGSLDALLGADRLGVVTIGQALHWMDHERLFAELRPLLRPGGGVAVVTNGEPLWLQDSDWSRALRELVAEWLGQPVSGTCGTDFASHERYRVALEAAGFATDVRIVEYTAGLDVDEIVGSLFSAMAEERLPEPQARPRFTERVRRAVEPHGPLTETVRVRVLTGRAPR